MEGKGKRKRRMIVSGYVFWDDFLAFCFYCLLLLLLLMLMFVCFFCGEGIDAHARRWVWKCEWAYLRYLPTWVTTSSGILYLRY